MLHTNPVDFLKQMEETLRKADCKNRLTGLYIEIEYSTAQIWLRFLKEMIEANEQMKPEKTFPRE